MEIAHSRDSDLTAAKKAECAPLFRPTVCLTCCQERAASAMSSFRHNALNSPGPEDDLTTRQPIASLLQPPPRVVNIGLPEFAAELRAAGIAVLQLDWAPPVIADPRIRALLAKLS